MPVKFFTNTDENTLLRKFERVFTYLPKSRVPIYVDYADLYCTLI